MLATGLIVAYGYFIETFIGMYSGSTYERFMLQNRWFGPYALVYWALILCNILIPQVLWFPKVRANITVLFLVSLDILIGMWLERFVIVVTSLQPRLPAVVVGTLRADALGLGGVPGNDWLLQRVHVPLHSHHADDLDL